MKVVSLSYNTNNGYRSPDDWLNRIDAYTGVLESLTGYGEVISIHLINYQGFHVFNNVSNHFFRYTWLQLLMPAKLHLHIKSLSPDVILLHDLRFSWQIILLKRALGKKVKIVVQHHAERPWRGIRAYMHKLADRQIDTYLFTSSDLARPWIEGGLIGDATKIRELMLASSRFVASSRQVARQATGVAGHPVYLWIGRLDPNKDPMTVLRAFLRFTPHYANARLYLIYQTTDLLHQLTTALSQSPEAQNNVVLVGKVDHEELQSWCNSADFIVSSSHYESGGVALCEAMSCGCIPIVTDIPSFRTMTGHGKVGIFFRPGDEAGLLDALVKSTRLDLELEKRRVLDHFEKELSFKAIARRLFEIVSSLGVRE